MGSFSRGLTALKGRRDCKGKEYFDFFTPNLARRENSYAISAAEQKLVSLAKAAEFSGAAVKFWCHSLPR